MPPSRHVQVNLIEELRLRRWARENYVSAEERDRAWPPIVLDEMIRRDAELVLQSAAPKLQSVYVPLPPNAESRIDAAHDSIPQPKLLAAPIPNPAIELV